MLSKNFAGPSDADLVSYQDKLKLRSVLYDPGKDYSDMTQLGLLSHQKAKVIEETRAYQAMSAQELTRAIQQALVEANEARKIGTGNMHGLLSGKILVGISCALVGVT